MNVDGPVLVTGGTGLVGAPITSLLLSENREVVLLSRSCPDRLKCLPGLKWIPCDFRSDFTRTLQNIGPVSAIVHAAAAVVDAGTAFSVGDLLTVNTLATEKLCNWAVQGGAKRIVFISSFTVLRKPYREPVRERDPTGPATVYGMTKLLSEEILQRFTHEFGLESFILRISSPIPAEFDDLPRTVVRNWLEAARKGCDLHVNGTGQRSQDFVSCDDIARAVSCSLKTQLGHGLFHIGSGQPVTMLTLARLISGFRNSEIVMVGSDPNEGDRFVLSLDAATRDLGFEPRTTGLEAISRLASAIL